MKIRKELWFGFALMVIILIPVVIYTPWASFVDGHLDHADLGALGLLMLALIVVAIMLGFPTAFTLMGMGVFFGWLAYRSVNPALATQQILDLMVQRAYSVMSNDVLIAIPLFVFMGYLVERANLIEKLFKSLHLSLARVPGALAVATIVTCAIFATATGIVGAVVTLMGLLALPAMLRAGYNIKVAAGAITAGGCLGILIPPSVLLIVYGATAGVSVVKLYAGAFFPGVMLAALYVVYVIVLAKWKPHLAPPLSAAERVVVLPPLSQALSSRRRNALTGLFGALSDPALPRRQVSTQLFVSLLPAISIAALLVLMYGAATAPIAAVDTTGLVQSGGAISSDEEKDKPAESSGLGEPPKEEAGLAEPPKDGDEVKEPPAEPAQAASAGTPLPASATTSGETVKAAGGRPGGAAAGTDLVLDRAGPGPCQPGARLLADELAAAGDLQDAAGVLLPSGSADCRGARLDRVRVGDTDRGGGGRCVWRPDTGRHLSLYRSQATQAKRRCGGHAERPRRHHQGILVPHGQDQRHGVLAVRRLVDLFRVFRAAGRPGDHRALGAFARA